MAKFIVYRVRVYVGPVHVAHYAGNARTAGYTNLVEGTEHVIADVLAPVCLTETDRLVMRNRIADTVYGAAMATGWRDVTIF